MKRKLILLFLVVSCMLCLAGCGKASVTSELRFHSDGSGSRTVNVTVRSEDARHIEGGFGRIIRCYNSRNVRSHGKTF